MNTFRRRATLSGVAAWLAGVATLFFAPMATASLSHAAEPENGEVNNSVVWVTTWWDGRVEVPFQDDTVEVFDATTYALCTGWFVSDVGHVATAGHCLEANSDTVLSLYADVIEENNIGIGEMSLSDLEWEYSIDDPTVYVGQPSAVDGPLKGEERISQIIAHQEFENGDNALLRVGNLKETPGLEVAAEKPNVGESVTSIGYAGSVDDVTDTDSQPPSQKQGSVSSHSTTTRGVPVIEIDAAVTQGMSGGPTINDSGEVIGINSFNINGESQAFNFITDTETLRAFLAQNSVPLSQGEQVDAEESGEPVSNEEEVPTAVAAPINESSNEGGGVSILTIVLIVAVVALAGGMVFLLIRQRKPQPALVGEVVPPATPAAQVPPPPPPSEEHRQV